MPCYYSEAYPHNEGFFTDIEEFIEWWNEESEPGEPRPEYVWGTTCTKLAIDATDVIESACENLHEDAASDLDVDGLQAILDEWCANQANTETYSADTKYAVRIPWGD